MSEPLTVIESMYTKTRREFDVDATKATLENLGVQFETHIVDGEFLVNAMAKDDMTRCWSFGMEQDYILSNYSMIIKEEEENGNFIYTVDLGDDLHMRFCENREYTYFCDLRMGKTVWRKLKELGFGVEEFNDN